MNWKFLSPILVTRLFCLRDTKLELMYFFIRLQIFPLKIHFGLRVILSDLYTKFFGVTKFFLT